MVDLSVIAKRLIKLRGKKSREEVAKELNISVSALGMYEQGRRMPRDEVKVRFAEYYSVSVQDIFFAK
nr:MAG TPA: helix-turn-helix domain protein [Caudoviricetes sp.]